MKKLLSFLLLFPVTIFGQKVVVEGFQTANPDNVYHASQKNNYLLPIAKMSIKGSHPIGINSTKTVHIIFPSSIKEVDAGIPQIITEITPSFTNVLKVKSVVDGQFDESNLTVLTANGDLYSFIVNYQENPEILNISVDKNYLADVSASQRFNLSTFRNSDFLLPGVELSENQIRDNFTYILNQKRKLKNIGVKNLDISAFVQNIYMDNSLLYLSILVDNQSGVPYPIDFIKVYVRDVEGPKRQTIQEEEMPVIQLDQISQIKAGDSQKFVVAIPRITISSDKQLDFEIYERKGGRHLRFPINSKVVSNAKTLPQ